MNEEPIESGDGNRGDPTALPPGPSGRADAQANRLANIVSMVEGEVAAGRPADAVLTRYLRDHREMGSRDRRLASATVFSLFRWRGWTGSLAGAGPAAVVRAALLDGLTEAPMALRALARRAGNEALMDALPGFQGLEDRAAWVSKHWKPDARIGDLVPAWALDAVAPGARPFPFTAERWIASLQTRPPLWLRADGVSGDVLAGTIAEGGTPAKPHACLRHAVRVDGHPSIPELEKRIGAVFRVQDLASQAVGAVCDPKPGESWWDVCAGAGGKSLDLLARMDGRGFLRAGDARPAALNELLRRVEKRRSCQGDSVEIEAVVHDATGPPPDTRRFDGVLVDAPCSGLGTWGRNPDARWRTPPDAPANAAGIQVECLVRAAEAVRPGGTLVYAVCTLTREECEGVADAFASRRSDFVPDAVPHPLDTAQPSHRLWFLPWTSDCTGMFAARWVRRAV